MFRSSEALSLTAVSQTGATGTSPRPVMVALSVVPPVASAPAGQACQLVMFLRLHLLKTSHSHTNLLIMRYFYRLHQHFLQSHPV